MTEREQSPGDKQKWLVKQARIEANYYRQTRPKVKLAIAIAQLYENLANEILRLQKIVTEFQVGQNKE